MPAGDISVNLLVSAHILPELTLPMCNDIVARGVLRLMLRLVCKCAVCVLFRGPQLRGPLKNIVWRNAWRIDRHAGGAARIGERYHAGDDRCARHFAKRYSSTDP